MRICISVCDYFNSYCSGCIVEILESLVITNLDQITASNKKHRWLDCGSRLDYDIEAVMVAVIPS